MHVTTKTILKQSISFHVDSDGKFWAEDKDGNSIVRNCDNLKQCVRLVRMELKKERVVVSVPFTTSDLKPAIALGRHARNYTRILVWIDDGSPKGIRGSVYAGSYHPTPVLKPDVPHEDIQRLKRLFARKQKAQEILAKIQHKLDNWNEEHSFDLGKAVDEAVKEAQNPTPPPQPMPKGKQQLEDEHE